ncbi:beta-lactamase family protein [Rhizobiaceae bacterium n13]|uniref:Beta-lactamase family protein n=1 Tax=Ferirhizobium litorale TaxID=2927786 RepID=A0AAE3U310_9HYPH|nr:serine hydrolase [Fererhizobium litorale]MDI7863769.1 beta-lactamase family protein [Fererhizobium litorale]MDI7924131.1 beta-lactamase family protein [Fererhizobium litorale]
MRRRLTRWALAVAAVIAAIVLGAGLLLLAMPPEKLLVVNGYSAKTVCSNVFIAHRKAEQVLALDVQAPGHPLLKFVRLTVDEDNRMVTARFLGLIAPARAIYRDGYGCAAVPGGNIAAAREAVPESQPPLPPAPQGIWPDGEDTGNDIDPALQAVVADTALTGPEMRAVVVAHGGRIAAETYGAGFDKDTAMVGWSMTKTLNAVIIGRLMQEGMIGFTATDLLPEWRNDDRAGISLAALLSMEPGLAFNEDYGDVSDVTRMLYLEPDMAGFAASKPLVSKPGDDFNYSTGTSLILSRVWMSRFADPADARAYPRETLFAPIGMRSAVFEADASGTLVGGSYLYATARDWARFGLLLARDGMWNGNRLLPEDFMAALRQKNSASSGRYSRAQSWLVPPYSGGGPDKELPEDTFWAQGHDGQSIAIVPSKDLVVVRMGLTPGKLRYRPQHLVKAIIDQLD